ncbi:hypothetical protein B0H17DRAFT_1045419 [Mycena rosella]|uniref:Extracellular conserved serine-rich protein n=1 Tax=Mycena rosella TaxID=1033263 RepID=A0AAD7DXK6_MYCRO|nr:hypothetical protein B0H17DRAFT_1045419 [Mycena rosella]
MFAMFKLCAILALAAPFASALSISSVTGNAVSEGSLTITWTTSTSDAAGTFSIELNHASFNDALALANNVDSSSLSATVALNNIPVGDGYTITFVDISDINTVFATSAPFSIGPVSATQSTTIKGSTISSSSSTLASKTSSGSGSGSGSATGVPLSTKPLPTSNTGFGTTGSATQTTPTSSGSAGPSTTGSSGARSTFAIPGALLVAFGVVAASALAL